MFPVLSLFAVAVTGEGALIAGLLATVGFLGAKALFRKDTEIETRRANAIRASQILSAKGLKKIPAALLKYAVGDYSGLAHDIKGLADEVTDPDRIGLEFNNLFDNMLTEKLTDADALADLAKKVVAAQAAMTAGKAALATPKPAATA